MNLTSSWLHESTQRWADRPAEPDEEWLGAAPEWIEGDDMARIFRERAAVYTHGEVMWGHILMANSVAWKPGFQVAPGTLLLSHDPMVQSNPSLYRAVSERFWRLKSGDDTRAVGLRSQIPLARDEQGRWFRLPLPRSLTSGRMVYATCAFFWSAAVPGGCLQHNLVPVAALRSGAPPTVMVLPKSLWPTELRERWEGSATEA